MNDKKLPEGWEVKKLGDIAEVKGGKRLPKGHILLDHKTDHPYIRVTDFLDFSINKNFIKYISNITFNEISNYTISKDDVFISIAGTIGQVGMIPNELDNSNLTENAAKIVISNKVNPIYIMRFLASNSSQKQIKILIASTGVSKLALFRIKSIEVPIPFPNDPKKSLEVQQKIVSKLDAFFSHYNNLKEEKQKAKKNYEKILQSAIASFLSEGKWKKERLGDICIINPKKSEVKDISENLDVSFVPMNSVDEKEGIMKRQEIRKLKDVKKGYTYFKENDVLFAKITPCMENGKAVIATNLKNDIGFGSTEFHIIRPNENMLADYIFYFIRQPSFRKEAAAKMSGTAGQLRVPSGFLENYELPIPPIEEQKRIIKMLNKIKEDSRLIYDEQSNIDSNLSQLPKAVLSRAFKGGLV